MVIHLPRKPFRHLRTAHVTVVDQPNQTEPLPLRVKLAGHFKSDKAAEGISEQMKRPVGMQCADLLYVVCGHVFDTSESRFSPYEGWRLDTIYGPVDLHVSHEPVKSCQMTVYTVDQE